MLHALGSLPFDPPPVGPQVEVQHMLNCGGVGSCEGGSVDGPYQWIKKMSEKGTGISGLSFRGCLW